MFASLSFLIISALPLSISLSLALLYWPRSFCSSFCLSPGAVPESISRIWKAIVLLCFLRLSHGNIFPVSNSKSENQIASIFLGETLAAFPLASNSKWENRIAWKNSWEKIGSSSHCFKIENRISWKRSWEKWAALSRVLKSENRTGKLSWEKWAASSPVSNSKSKSRIAWAFSWEKRAASSLVSKSISENTIAWKFLGKNGQHFPVSNLRPESRIAWKVSWENGQHFSPASNSKWKIE